MGSARRLFSPSAPSLLAAPLAARRSSVASRRLFPAAASLAPGAGVAAVAPPLSMAGLHPVLNRLRAEQQATHVGPGGMAQAMDPEERRGLIDQGWRHRPTPARQAFALGPDDPDAADALAIFVGKLVDTLTASYYHLRELEASALVYLDGQFDGKAGHQWTTVKHVARQEATTSGIGVQSVLYRALRDLLHQYPVHNIKNTVLAKKAQELRWDSKQSTSANRSRLQTLFEAYDRGVTRTQGLDRAARLPAQDWDTRLAELQAIWPAWIHKLIADAPDRFNTEGAAWACILEDDSRRAVSRQAGGGGGSRLMQIAAELEAAGVGVEDLAAPMPLYGCDEAAGLCAMPRTQNCWRCGASGHRRADCPLPKSFGELHGHPPETWARTSPLPAGQLPTSTLPSGSSPAASSAVVAQLAAATARMDRQELLLSRLLEGLSAPAIALSPPATSVMSTAPALPLAALSTPPALPAATMLSSAPVILGGPQPPGYAQVGQNGGVPLWIQEPLLAASVALAPELRFTDEGAGNEGGSQA